MRKAGNQIKTVTWKVGRKRLLKLAAHLLTGKLGHAEFDFREWNTGGTAKHPCGTMGCAVGECPMIFKEWTFRRNDERFAPRLRRGSRGLTVYDAASFFGMSFDDADSLFAPERGRWWVGGSSLRGDATRYQVAASIAEYVSARDEYEAERV